jgi:uncharacterized membrane protein YbhN (UPF0104 family)
MYSPVGVAYAIVGSSFLIQPLSIYIALSEIDGEFSELFERISYPIVGSGIMYATVVLIDKFLIPSTGSIKFISPILLGVTCYISLMMMFEKWKGYELVRMFRRLKNLSRRDEGINY